MNTTMIQGVYILSFHSLTCIANMFSILYFRLVAARDASEHCDVLTCAMGSGVDTNDSSEHWGARSSCVECEHSATPDLHGGRGLPNTHTYNRQSPTSMEVGDCR